MCGIFSTGWSLDIGYGSVDVIVLHFCCARYVVLMVMVVLVVVMVVVVVMARVGRMSWVDEN